MDHSTSSLRGLFEAALALSPAARAAFLSARCFDENTRARIEALLAADAGEGEPLEKQSAEQLVRKIGEIDEDFKLSPGARIGPFELLEVLGEGGSSTVFRAQRESDGVTQQVALKLLHRNLHAPDAQRRFRAERKVLAQLQHPGIARLIEGGVTDDGLGYIALELIDGVPITEYARNHNLNLRARLRLFLQACAAVAAAHRALIVHRDLKPSNVLVTPEAEVKLLDFGIAKVLDDDTRTVVPAFTPAYAAPEQRDGGPISTATDVYALGMLLGELITGKRLDGSSGHTPSGQIAENTDPGVLPAPAHITRRELRGDLDTIVLKAIEAEPERRYASASALAEDVDRLLAGQPVIAHPPTRWYRTRKFVSRHRGGVATTAAFLLAVFAALGLALWQTDVARTQARLAHQQTQRAEAVRDLLVNLFDAEIPSRPRDEMPTTAELLERGAQYALNDLGAMPAVQSDLLRALGRVYDHLALPDKGRPLLDASIAAARRVEPSDPALLGAALSERGELELSGDRYASAIDYLDDAIVLQRSIEADSLGLAVSLDRRAQAESGSGAHENALADYRAALAIREHRLPAGDAEILNSLSAIGNAYNRAGKPHAALPLLRQAADGALAKFGQNHVKTAHYLKSYAATEGMLRNFAEAAALTERVVRIERNLYPEGSPDIVNGLNNLGSLNLILGRLRAARDVLDEGRTILNHAGRGRSMGQTFVLGNLARVEEALGRRELALGLLREAEGIALELVGEQHARSVSLAVQRDRVELLLNPATAARIAGHLRVVLAHPEALDQFRANSEIEARHALGLAAQALGRDTDAEQSLRAAVALMPTDHVDPRLLPTIVALARWEYRHDRRAEATRRLQTAIEKARIELPSTHYVLGELYLELAEMQATSQPTASRANARAARLAFAELPESHPSRERLAALDGHASETVSGN